MMVGRKRTSSAKQAIMQYMMGGCTSSTGLIGRLMKVRISMDSSVFFLFLFLVSGDVGKPFR